MVEALWASGPLLSFTEEEQKVIDAGSKDPAVVAGGRRQLACVLL